METKYFLNPDYTIRKDGNRYLLYSRFMKKYDETEDIYLNTMKI